MTWRWPFGGYTISMVHLQSPPLLAKVSPVAQLRFGAGRAASFCPNFHDDSLLSGIKAIKNFSEVIVIIGPSWSKWVDLHCQITGVHVGDLGGKCGVLNQFKDTYCISAGKHTIFCAL